MKISQAVFSLAAAFSAVSASATQVTVQMISVDGVKDSAGYNVSPYNGKVDGVTYQIFCDDFDHNVNVPSTFTANVSTISNLSLSRFGAASTSLYQEVFYLSSYLGNAAYASSRADIQDAIWGIFSVNAPNQAKASVQTWKTQAQNNYAGKDYSTFRVLTDASNRTGGVQELFINTATAPPGLTSTPEPATWAMLLTGGGAVAFARIRRKSV